MRLIERQQLNHSNTTILIVPTIMLTNKREGALTHLVLRSMQPVMWQWSRRISSFPSVPKRVGNIP